MHICINKGSKNRHPMVKEHFLECLSNKQKITLLHTTESILRQYYGFTAGTARTKSRHFHQNVCQEVDKVLETLGIQNRFVAVHLTVYLQQSKVQIMFKSRSSPYHFSELEFQFTPFFYTCFDAIEYQIRDKVRKATQLQSWNMAYLLGEAEAERIKTEIKTNIQTFR